MEPYQGGEEAGGRWARELVWALVWVGKRGARQGDVSFGRVGAKMENLESMCVGVGLRKKEGS